MSYLADKIKERIAEINKEIKDMNNKSIAFDKERLIELEDEKSSIKIKLEKLNKK